MNDKLVRLRDLPRLRLAHLPTPLEAVPRLAAVLGLKSLWVKRDDCTGLGMGGNKARKLEFTLAAAQAANADCVACSGVPQSNTVRQVAAACAKLGLECHSAIMEGRVANAEPEYSLTGNILLDKLYGAIIHRVSWCEDRNYQVELLANELISRGRRVFVVPYGVSDKLGAMGYVLAAEEIVRECPDVKWIVHGSGSAGTQAGLLVGLRALGHPARVIGIDVDCQAERVMSDVSKIASETGSILGLSGSSEKYHVEVLREWSGPAYGQPGPFTEEAMLLAARLEGLALDPVYSGKAMAGLIGMARSGRFAKGDTVVWIHTGGSPAIFAYPRTITRVISAGAHRN